jgi:hypothetical protein
MMLKMASCVLRQKVKSCEAIASHVVFKELTYDQERTSPLPNLPKGIKLAKSNKLGIGAMIEVLPKANYYKKMALHLVQWTIF